MQQREQIENQLQAIEQVLNGMGAPMPRMAEAGGMRRGPGRPPGGGAMAARMVSGGRGGRGGRAPRAGSLKEYILRVLRQKGGTMAVKDITAGVTRAGYKSKNQTLAKSVGIALTELPGVEKVGRGQFQLT